MRNTIEASKRANAKLIFFDSVYMYGKVDGVMTEETPFNPCSKKGDFYGPDARTSVPNILVFDKFAKGAKASWLVNDSVRHSFTFHARCRKEPGSFGSERKGVESNLACCDGIKSADWQGVH
jgi:hypothetical protein